MIVVVPCEGGYREVGWCDPPPAEFGISPDGGTWTVCDPDPAPLFYIPDPVGIEAFPRPSEWTFTVRIAALARSERGRIDPHHYTRVVVAPHDGPKLAWLPGWRPRIFRPIEGFSLSD